MLEGSCQSQALNMVGLCEDYKTQMLRNSNWGVLSHRRTWEQKEHIICTQP